MRKILSALSVLLLVFVLVACGSKTYTVTFESNGGSSVTAIEDVEDGATITAPTAPTRSGYTFDGWFKESELTNQWIFATDVVIENITLYAKWTEVPVETDQDKVDAAHAWLSLGNLADLDVDDRVIMPTSYTVNGVSISWTIDKEAYISVSNGRITQPDHETGDQTVTITATLTFGSASRNKVFTATVKALPIPSEADPFVFDDFSEYNDGNLIGQGAWATVSGKEGLTTYTVVSSITGLTIPDGSKAVEVKDYTETQTTIALNFTTDVWVLEMDFMQTANGAPIRLQPQTSGIGLQFGFSGAGSDAARVYYRDPETQADHTKDLALNTWHTLRLEVDMASKAFELFVYEDGNLMPVTPGPVSWDGFYAPTFSQLYIRSGSSTATSLNQNTSYFTNIIANNTEAMPRPEEDVKLGTITGIPATVSIPKDGTFNTSVPTVTNYYGEQRLLIEDTDYSLTITNPVDTAVAGEYTVSYLFTNLEDATDTKTITTIVTVYEEGEPNVLSNVVSTYVTYPETLTDLSFSVTQPSGTLYYLLSNNATETAAAILLGTSFEIDAVDETISDIDTGEFEYIHLIVSLNGESNIINHQLNRQTYVVVTTEQQFYDMTQDGSTDNYYVLGNDIDFTGFTWPASSTASGVAFKTGFNGQGYTVSNITQSLSSSAVYGGIFQRTEAAHISNLIIDNALIDVNERAGILIGNAVNAPTTIENVIIMNSEVKGTSGNGVGILIGYTNADVEITNVSIISSIAYNSGKNVAYFIGRADRLTVLTDTYVYDSEAQSANADTTTGIAGFVGYTNNNAANVIITRGVIEDSRLIGRGAGSLVGYYRYGDLTAVDVFTDVTFIYLSDNGTHGIVGRDDSTIGTATFTNVWVRFVDKQLSQGYQVDPAFELADLSGLNETWWNTNIPNILSSNLWTMGEVFPLLVDYDTTLKPLYEITLDYDEVVDNETIMMREDAEFAHVAPDVIGYTFSGWYLDDTFTTELPGNYAIEGNVTIYGKYEQVTSSTVTFTSSVDGLDIPDQEVNYEEFATQPVVEDQMIDEVMKEVVGWTLNGEPFNFTTPIVGNIELVAVWQIKSYTVTFDGENAVLVEYGNLVEAPTENPTHEMFAEIAFNEWRLDGTAYDFDTPVTANINLVSNFALVGDITITTAEQFHYMATVESTYPYVLDNDIDFTGFEWVATGASFKGTFDGQGFTISNLSIVTTQYGGIFSRANEATIENLFIDNLHVESTGRAGGLIGRVENGSSIINNIVVMNSFVEGSDSNGVGGLIGLVSVETTITNVAIVDTYVENIGQKNVGAFVGRVDGGELIASDIYISGAHIKSDNSGTSDVAASAFVGYVRDSAASILTSTRVIVFDTLVEGNSGGAFVGYNRFPGTSDLADAYFEVTFANTGARTGLIGYNRDQVTVIDQSTIFGSFTGATTHSQVLDLENTVIPTNDAWWTTNLSNILASELWMMAETDPILVNYNSTLSPLHEVTLDYDGLEENEMIRIREDVEFTHEAPEVTGHMFAGWYIDDAFTIELPANYMVTEDMVIFGKYESVPASTVTFTSGVDGLIIPSQDVNYGDVATEPVVDDQMIDDVMKEVVGWTLDGEPFDFLTPIFEVTELVAVWEIKSYTVTFDGENEVLIDYGDLVTEPIEDPVHIFAEITFNEWRLEGVTYDFNTPVTANINLVSNFNEPVGDITITTAEQFHYMATVESTYSYVLANDIDFTGFEWVATGDAFKGTFNGQMFTVSNLSITTTGYGGIFARANGAWIESLIIDNLNVVSTARAGGLIGRVENSSTTIENIVIMNSSIEGTDSNGVGGLIGLVSTETFVFNVAVIDTFVENIEQKNVGGFVGRVDGGELIADDIFISNVYVKSTNTGSSDVAASAFVGYVRDSAASTVSAIRVVVLGTTVEGNAGGAFIGYNRYPGTADLMDAYFEVTFIGSRTGLIGYNRDQVAVLDQSSIFGSFTDATTHTQVLDLENIAIPTDNTWWETNLEPFTLSDFWTVGNDGSIILDIADFAPVVTYTVTFDSNDGSAVSPIDVVEGELLIAPAEPAKDGYTFEGWYKDAGLTMAWDFDVDVVTEDITLYAMWEVAGPEGTAITTIEEFYTVATTGGSDSTYYLANDLDFTGYTWAYINYNFTRELNGNGKTISNLTISDAEDRAGIFSRANGANIYDLTIDNASVTAPTGRAGILIGEVDGSSVTVSNVTIMNSDVSGNKGEGVGVLIGYTKSGAVIENVKIIDSTATNANKNAAYITGRANAAITIIDTYIVGSTATSTNTNTDAGVGGFVGYTNDASVIVTITRSVIEDSKLNGRGAGSLIGYYNKGSLVINDVFTDIEFTYEGSNGQHGIIGRRTVADTADPALTNAFGHFAGQQEHVDAVDLAVEFKLADLNGLDQTWWTTNIPNIDASPLWTFNAVTNFYELS